MSRCPCLASMQTFNGMPTRMAAGYAVGCIPSSARRLSWRGETETSVCEEETEDNVFVKITWAAAATHLSGGAVDISVDGQCRWRCGQQQRLGFLLRIEVSLCSIFVLLCNMESYIQSRLPFDSLLPSCRSSSDSWTKTSQKARQRPRRTC